ncbi:MAG: bifunctional (p)ppGpp synthetase/guanosine-3',5'-bis(diphosphate) 3'-pyrophosphohydrolase [Oscillospiraceae bacterium]|jgi:GTP pyrophosphokinase|nr:bifunctional (p)ppGpp synthetase/guanosine-3',5'-bis(diphosphate) 3'-pyrophosphohydrolase [Oscillospiraceae bacterium]
MQDYTPNPNIPDTCEHEFDALVNAVRAYNPATDVERLRAAFEFARERHAGQKRKDESPYITHPLATARNVAEMGLDDDSLIAAMLHDCVEDTSATTEDIAKLFGEDVAVIVDGVTKLTQLSVESKEQAQMENLRKMFMAMARDIRVILIKIADRLHNMRTMEYQTPAKQREKSLETMNIYAPIAHRLGMQKIKWELEDLSLRYLEPEEYERIRAGVAERDRENEGFLTSMVERVRAHMEESGLECEVYGRVKHIYSIYRKMKEQNKQFAEILDLYAMRIVVGTIPDCYRALGLVHQICTPIPDTFKDYINIPKPNGYQSLHTSVVSGNGIPFEVQIRTLEMHRSAEYGVAAHWKYKSGGQGAGDEERYAWIRRLLESQQDLDPEDFYMQLRTDMFADEIFVFTPQGDVISLPRGATPIDFAYAIHSEVGNRMNGATVNGRIATYSTKLENGNIVRILTSKAANGPSRDWLDIVKSSEARNKIRQWFKRERREENILHGKSAFEAELRQSGISLAEIASGETLERVLRKLAFPSLDDLYAAIGYGGVSARKSVNKIRDDVLPAIRSAKTADTEPLIPELKPARKRENQTSGVIVDGLGNCLIKFAKCCTPVPGDDIAGYVTRASGVSVHRRDCENYLNFAADPKESGRLIGVQWANAETATFSSSLTVRSRLRDGVLMPIINQLAAMHVHLSQIAGQDVDEGSTVSLTVDVRDSDELTLVTARLRALDGVFDVRRG